MEQKSLNNLEFDKILAKIAAFAGSQAAKEAIFEFHPITDAAKMNFSTILRPE
jgi:dsDNA-specific endonuclease/ATPase MutS2